MEQGLQGTSWYKDLRVLHRARALGCLRERVFEGASWSKSFRAPHGARA